MQVFVIKMKSFCKVLMELGVGVPQQQSLERNINPKQTPKKHFVSQFEVQMQIALKLVYPKET